MPGFIFRHQQHLKTVLAQPCACQVFNQYNLRPLGDQLARGAYSLFYAVNRMLAQDLQFNQVGGNNIAGGQCMTNMELRNARRYDAAFFRMSHHRIAEIFRRGVCRFHLAHNAEDMLPLLRRTQIAAQYGIAAFKLVYFRDTLNDFRQMRRRHHAAGPFSVLGMIRELDGIERPDVGPEAAHRKFRSAVASMSKNNVGLNGEDVLHGVLTKPCQNKRGVVSHAPAYF